METVQDRTVDYSICLICSSSVISSDIKIEPNFDQVEDDQSVIIFLLTTLLEIPLDKVEHEHAKLSNQQLNTLYCESCTKLIHTAKSIYSDILELARKFREVQKQIVEQISKFNLISNVRDVEHKSELSTSINHEILVFCRKFLNTNDFNGFGYPFIVKGNPVLSSSFPTSTKCQGEYPTVDKVKEEPLSESEDGDNEDCEIGEDDEDEDYRLEQDNVQDSWSASANEDSLTESDSDLEPLPPKKPAKKVPVEKSSASLSLSSCVPPVKANRKSITLKSKDPVVPNRRPRSKFKPVPPKKTSKFDRLYPDYPKRSRDPRTKKYHCLEPFCSKMYPRKTALERHIIIQHLQDNFYKCQEPNCNESFPVPELYEDHVSWHKGIPRWKCEETVTNPDGGTSKCTEAYFNRRKLTRHVQKVHHNDKPFVCDICGRKFNCQDYLTGHKFQKHTEKGKSISEKYTSHICNYCGKIFKVKSNLDTHINLVHEKTVGKYGCQFCECKFYAKATLKQHLWGKHQFSLEGYQPPKRKGIKVEERPYQCEVKGCRLAYRKEATLKKHVEEKHRGDGGNKEGVVYQFNCKYCGKGFHLKAKWEQHEIAHENKESKPYCCEVCGNRFATLPYLKIHRWNIHKIGSEKARKNK